MRYGVALLIPLLVLTSLCSAESTGDEKPNVILLLADDLGWTGSNAFGSDLYETPHLDRLAANGLKFTAAYSACTVCSPTRASIMTGMSPARLHLTDFIAGQNRPWARLNVPDWTKELEHRHVTIAEALRAAGYKTAQVGKWHLEGRGPSGSNGQPVDHGFETQVLRPRQAKGYMLPKGFNASGESKSDYLTDYLTDQALQVIDLNREQPFFLYFAYHVPHTPIQGRPDLVAKFQAKIDPSASHQNPHYAAMVASLDASVGRILARLRRHEIDRKTIVIFWSDNGGLTQRYGKIEEFTDNSPLRRGKGSAYEGGIRVPAIVYWPDVTGEGSVCDEPVITTDLYPTILQMTQADGDATHNANVDGASIVPLLKNPRATLDRNLYWHYPHYHAGGDGPHSAIRSGRYKLIEWFEDGRTELYDLQSDPGESQDLADEMPQRVAELKEELEGWRMQVNVQMLTPNPNYDPARASEVGAGDRKDVGSSRSKVQSAGNAEPQSLPATQPILRR